MTDPGDLPGIIVVGAVTALAGIISAQEAGDEPVRGPTSARPRPRDKPWLSSDDPRTYGRTRLSFADTADIDEFVTDARPFRARRDHPRRVARASGCCAARTVSGRTPMRRCCASRSPRASSTRRSSRRWPTSRDRHSRGFRPHLDAAERAVSLRAAARRRAGDAAPRRRRPDHARSVRQLRPQHHVVPVCRRRARRGVRRHSVFGGDDPIPAAAPAQLGAARASSRSPSKAARPRITPPPSINDLRLARHDGAGWFGTTRVQGRRSPAARRSCADRVRRCTSSCPRPTF